MKYGSREDMAHKKGGITFCRHENDLPQMSLVEKDLIQGYNDTSIGCQSDASFQM